MSTETLVYPVYVQTDTTEGRGPRHIQHLFTSQVEAEKMVGMLPEVMQDCPDGVPRPQHSGAHVGGQMKVHTCAESVPEYMHYKDKLELRGVDPKEIERRKQAALAKLNPQERRLLGL